MLRQESGENVLVLWEGKRVRDGGETKEEGEWNGGLR